MAVHVSNMKRPELTKVFRLTLHIFANFGKGVSWLELLL